MLDNTGKLHLLNPFLLELENIQPLPQDLKSCLVNDADIVHAAKGDIIYLKARFANMHG